MKWPNVSLEIAKALYGDADSPPQGHWVIFRWFHIGEYSKYWDPIAKQAIGGPKWKYTDFPLRTSFHMGNMRNPFDINENNGGFPGMIDVNYRVYILQRCYRPKEGDIIFEFDCDYPDKPEEFIEIAKTARRKPYIIYGVHPVRSEKSTINYYLAYTEKYNRGY